MGLVSIENFEWDKLKLAKSGRAVKLLYNKEPLQICTSTLYTPFGVKSQNKEWSNFTEYSLDCSVNSSISSESATMFKEFLEKLDEYLKNLLISNLEMFANAKNVNPETISYSPIYKQNGDYPKLFKLQLSRDKMGNFDTFVFDSSKSKIKLTDDNITTILTKGKPFKCIIECSKVWYFNEKVGSMWNAVQLKFSENKVQLQSQQQGQQGQQTQQGQQQFTKDKINNNEINPNSVYTTMMID